MIENDKIHYLFASHTLMGGTFVVGSHHLARQLSKLEKNVVHISSPMTPFHLLKFKDKMTLSRLKRSILQPKIKYSEYLVDQLPFALFPWALSNYIYNKQGLNLTNDSMIPFLSKMKRKKVEVMLIDQPTFVGLEKRIKPDVLVYRATDLYKDMANSKNIVDAEIDIIKRSDALIATSKVVLDYIRSYNPDVPYLLLENGVEYHHFSKECPEPVEYKGIQGKKAVYAGAVDERLDLEAFSQIAKMVPELNIIIIGPISNDARESLKGYSNIHVLGSRNYQDLPAYLSHSDIGLLPLSNHKANEGRSPMKLYEYGAAGLPVVSKATAELSRRTDDHVFLYSNYDELIEKVNEIYHSVPSKDHIKKQVEKYSWESKAVHLNDFMRNLIEETRSSQ